MDERSPYCEAVTVFDFTKMLRSFGGDRGTLQKLARLFLEDSPRQLEAMREALARRDTSALEHVAHRFKGTAGYFAADSIFAAAARLEAIARSLDLDGADAACAELEREILQLTRALSVLDQEPKRASRPSRQAHR
jgi:two-component system, sensor histidine kinase and response regulator